MALNASVLLAGESITALFQAMELSLKNVTVYGNLINLMSPDDDESIPDIYDAYPDYVLEKSTMPVLCRLSICNILTDLLNGDDALIYEHAKAHSIEVSLLEEVVSDIKYALSYVLHIELQIIDTIRVSSLLQRKVPELLLTFIEGDIYD